MVPLTEAIVCDTDFSFLREFIKMGTLLTNGDAVGPSKIATSSEENGMRGIMNTRMGIKSMIMTGNPMAAINY